MARKKRSKKQRRDVATRQDLLASQGTAVIELPALPVSGLRLLMRRVDLLELAGSGVWPQPISARVVRIITEGAGPQIDQARDDAEALAEYRKAAMAIARACIVVPPEEYVAGEVALEDLDADSLEPMFDDEHGPEMLHPTDLTTIATLAYAYGPGAHRFFRPA